MAEVVSGDQSGHYSGSTGNSTPTVVTFSPHPQAYFSGIAKPLLTPVEEKARQLDAIGIKQLVVLPFDDALAALGPEDFVEQILISQLQAQRVSVGSDFRFGKGRSGDAQGLKEIAARHGVPVVLVPLIEAKGSRISSSRIRAALSAGELPEATQLLGRPYPLTGTVVEGKRLGRTIGFPTANLQIPSEKFLPRIGVYSVWVHVEKHDAVPGVMNIGKRPTVDGQDLSVEVHLFDWGEDLYGQTLSVSLDKFIRTEQKFGSLEELKAQIVKDCEMARESLCDRSTYHR